MDCLQNVASKPCLDSGYGISTAISLQQEAENHEERQKTHTTKDDSAWPAFTRGIKKYFLYSMYKNVLQGAWST